MKKVVVHLSEENVELLEKVRQHYNSFRVPGQKHDLFAEDELDMLLVHILKEHAETLGLYSWRNGSVTAGRNGREGGTA